MKPISADNVFKLLTYGGVAKSVNVKITAYDYFRSVVNKCFKILIKKFQKMSFVLPLWYMESDYKQLLHSNSNLNPKTFIIFG